MKIRILHCDEDEEYGRDFKTAARKLGVKVTYRNRGEEAVAVFQRGLFDAVVSGINFPIFDGFSTLSSLRRKDPDIRFLFLSNYLDKKVRLKAEREAVPSDLLITKTEADSDILAVLKALKRFKPNL